MALNPVKIGPWPIGIDTFHDDYTHQAFQPGGEEPDRLIEAENVALDGRGNVFRRDGLTDRADVTAGKIVFGGVGLLIAQDGGTIEKVDTSTWAETNLRTGLSASASVYFHELAGKIFYANDTVGGIITAAGAATNWGMAVPPTPTLTEVAGDLPAGRYRVCCALIDGNGVMSGAPAAASVTLDGTKDIQVSFGSAIDSNATHVRVYASYTDSPGMWFVAQVAVGSMPYTITDVYDGATNSAEPLRTQFLQGPPTGIEGISSWGGFLFLWKGKYVIHSVGNFHHLFDFRTAHMKQTYDVQAVAGIDGGPLWVATTGGMVRYTGSPGADNFQRKVADNRAYAAGFALMDGSKIDGLGDVDGRVALFASEDGLAIGLPDGSLQHPNRNRIRWTDVNSKTATFTYNEQDNFNQILVTLE